jgi:hypothetical protein
MVSFRWPGMMSDLDPQLDCNHLGSSGGVDAIDVYLGSGILLL